MLTSVKYHGNLYILIPLNQRLALTRLRATGPWRLGLLAPLVARNNYLFTLEILIIGVKEIPPPPLKETAYSVIIWKNVNQFTSQESHVVPEVFARIRGGRVRQTCRGVSPKTCPQVAFL